MELTIQQACNQSANFMYIWADEKAFLSRINQKYAKIIRGKKYNQIKLLELSAEKYGKTYEEYKNAIRESFIEQWGEHPADALVILAQGGTIAGKNWSEGVYGVGALYTKTFTGYANITVSEIDGHIFNNGMDITETAKTVYTTIKKQAVPYQLFATVDGVIFMSQYNKTSKKYFAQSYSTADGSYSARTGNQINASDSADIWGTVINSIQVFVEWIISIFGGAGTNRTTINSENTLPSQIEDGFVQEAGMGEATGILLALAAGGILLAGGIKPTKKKK